MLAKVTAKNARNTLHKQRKRLPDLNVVYKPAEPRGTCEMLAVH